MKNTLNKFELPIVEDEKCELIEERFGLVGFGVIVKLLARIYGTGGYFCTWNDKVIERLSKSLGEAPRLISDVVAYAVGIGFFDGRTFAERSVLTSADIQAQYFRSVSRRSGITYDPDIVIGDFYKCCHRAVPFSEAPITIPNEKPSTEKVTEDLKKSATAATAATVATAVTAVTAETDATDDGIDPIIEMRCRHMFAKGQTVPIAQLIEMTGASTLVPVDPLPDVTVEEKYAAKDATTDVQSTCVPDDVSDAVDAVIEAIPEAELKAVTVETAAKENEPTDKDLCGRFIRNVKKPRRDKVYGQYFNVLLDDDEYADLSARVPNVGDYIQRLSAKLYDKSFKCESAYDAIIDCYERAQRLSGAA